MQFDPHGFITLAGTLAYDTEYDPVARTRTSVGRAYYTLFLAVRSAVRQAEGKPTHGRDDKVDHGLMRRALYASGRDELVAIAKMLDELGDIRRNADYVLDPPQHFVRQFESPKSVKLVLRRTEALLRTLPSIDWSPVLGKM